jgi:hypothetical protein
MPQPASLPPIPRQHLILTNPPRLQTCPVKAAACSFLHNLARSLQPSRYNEIAPPAPKPRQTELRPFGTSFAEMCSRYVPFYITEFNHTGAKNAKT